MSWAFIVQGPLETRREGSAFSSSGPLVIALLVNLVWVMTPGTQSSICTGSWSNNKVVWWWRAFHSHDKSQKDERPCRSFERRPGSKRLRASQWLWKYENYWTPLAWGSPRMRWRRGRTSGSTATATTTWLWDVYQCSTYGSGFWTLMCWRLVQQQQQQQHDGRGRTRHSTPTAITSATMGWDGAPGSASASTTAWYERQEAWFDSCSDSIFSAMMIRQISRVCSKSI